MHGVVLATHSIQRITFAEEGSEWHCGRPQGPTVGSRRQRLIGAVRGRRGLASAGTWPRATARSSAALGVVICRVFLLPHPHRVANCERSERRQGRLRGGGSGTDTLTKPKSKVHLWWTSRWVARLRPP